MPIFELNDVRFKETITDTIVGSDKNAMRMVEIVVRTTDKWETEICLSAFGKQIEKLDDLRPKPDDKMNIKMTLKSKPSPKGDRYYTSAAIYGFDITERAEQFGTVQQQGDWTEGIKMNPSNQEEDLPF